MRVIRPKETIIPISKVNCAYKTCDPLASLVSAPHGILNPETDAGDSFKGAYAVYPEAVRDAVNIER